LAKDGGGNKRGNPPELMKKINSRPEDLNIISLERALWYPSSNKYIEVG
jgi:hypothetical protein